jgi:type III secretory pathway component EscV
VEYLPYVGERILNMSATPKLNIRPSGSIVTALTLRIVGGELVVGCIEVTCVRVVCFVVEVCGSSLEALAEWVVANAIKATTTSNIVT